MATTKMAARRWLRPGTDEFGRERETSEGKVGVLGFAGGRYRLIHQRETQDGRHACPAAAMVVGCVPRPLSRTGKRDDPHWAGPVHSSVWAKVKESLFLFLICIFSDVLHFI